MRGKQPTEWHGGEDEIENIIKFSAADTTPDSRGEW